MGIRAVLGWALCLVGASRQQVCDLDCGVAAAGEGTVDRRYAHVVARQEQVVDAPCKLLRDVRHGGEHTGRTHAQRLLPAVHAVEQALVVVGKRGARRGIPASGSQQLALYLVVGKGDELLGAAAPDEQVENALAGRRAGRQEDGPVQQERRVRVLRVESAMPAGREGGVVEADYHPAAG